MILLKSTHWFLDKRLVCNFGKQDIKMPHICIVRVADLNSVRGIIGIEEYLIHVKELGCMKIVRSIFKDQLHVLSKKVTCNTI